MTTTNSMTAGHGLPPHDLIHGRSLPDWIGDHPLIADLVECRETQWFNPDVRPAAEALPEVGLTRDEVSDASDRLRRFAPYLAEAFPQTRSLGGIIESPLASTSTPGVWLKLDSRLPISGSINARGGIYEVLLHAETLALEAGLLSLDDDYRVLARPEARRLFSRHGISVGSTGNLGLSIGIMSARLGFTTQVHMSADARQWKKDMLRDHGVEVIEYRADYSAAVAAARRRAADDDSCYFIDGYLTVCDDNLFRTLARLHDEEGIDAEPSAVAGLAGIPRVREDAGYRRRVGLDDRRLSQATQVAWITGGSMVPPVEMAHYLERGHRLLHD